MCAFSVSIIASVGALITALTAAWKLALASALVAIATGIAARALSRRSPAPMPHWFRWALFLPRAFQTSERLQAALMPLPGQRLLEIGPGVGIHALPIAAAIAPDGIVQVLDVQPEMLRDLMRRAGDAGVANVKPTTGDARRLPYRDHAFDGAYLISVLGEIPDAHAALREIWRVLRPHGRLVVGEIVADPDFVALRVLQQSAAAAGFRFDRRLGPRFAYFASFYRA